MSCITPATFSWGMGRAPQVKRVQTMAKAALLAALVQEGKTQEGPPVKSSDVVQTGYFKGRSTLPVINATITPSSRGQWLGQLSSLLFFPLC